MAHRLIFWLCALAIFAFGCDLRVVVRHPAYDPGFDEAVYVQYVDQLQAGGWSGFSEIVRTYIEDVQAAEFVFLPPFRIGYLFPAWVLTKISGMPSYAALRLGSALASCLFMLAGFLFALRWVSRRKALAVLAILACAPLQIHLGQFAFIDALTGLWAILTVGCLWESLQQPRHAGWLVATGVSYLGLCFTKQEIAVFVSLFVFVAIIAARRFKFSESSWRQLLVVTGAGLLAVISLVLLSGGLSPMWQAFSIYLERAQTLPYTIQTGDGPWHRYLLEYLLITPLVFLLAVGFALRGNLEGPRNVYLLGFILLTGAAMTSIPFGMNIRHTVMWDFPLALFAVQCVATLIAGRHWRQTWATAVIAVVCFTQLRLYGTIFKDLYDTDPKFMFRAVRILK